MILESPFPAAGPLGTTALTFPLAVLVLFLIPPTGAAAAALAELVARRPPRPPRRAVWRRVLRISSRDWSSFSDILEIVARFWSSSESGLWVKSQLRIRLGQERFLLWMRLNKNLGSTRTRLWNFGVLEFWFAIGYAYKSAIQKKFGRQTLKIYEAVLGWLVVVLWCESWCNKDVAS